MKLAQFTFVVLLSGLGLHATTWDAEPKHTRVAVGHGFELWVGGVNQDVVAIFRDGKLLVFDAIRNSRKEGINAGDITIGESVVVVRYGINGDLATLYGFSKSKNSSLWRVQVLDWPSIDGAFSIESGGYGEMLFNFGRHRDRNGKGDWNRKICWDGALWKTSSQTPPPSYAACTTLVPALKKGDAIGVPASDDRLEGPRLRLPRQ